MNKKNKREVALILAALLFSFLSFLFFSRNTEANNKIKQNEKIIKELQQDKEALYKDLEARRKKTKRKR